MAKYQHGVLVGLLLMGAGLAWGQESPAGLPAGPSSGATAKPASPSASSAQTQISLPRLTGRITADELGVVINTADPYSVAVGDYYVAQRQIPPEQVLRLNLPVKPVMTADEFETLKSAVDAAMGPKVQGLALVWRQPYAVQCNAITAALTLGYQADLCKQTCAASQPSRYVTYAGKMPARDLGMRLSMLLAARSVEGAKALIDRGVAADHQLSFRTRPAVNAYFVTTADKARTVRSVVFPPAGRVPALGLEIVTPQQAALPPLKRTLIYQTGQVRVEGLDAVDWVPGALADHLTSYGGLLDKQGPAHQMTALDWIESGATASYGTVSEPCNHLQKFPHPQMLLFSYVQGVSALEAYWHSVLWPGQGVFVGEPLAAPFARSWAQF